LLVGVVRFFFKEVVRGGALVSGMSIHTTLVAPRTLLTIVPFVHTSRKVAFAIISCTEMLDLGVFFNVEGFLIALECSVSFCMANFALRAPLAIIPFMRDPLLSPHAIFVFAWIHDGSVLCKWILVGVHTWLVKVEKAVKACKSVQTKYRNCNFFNGCYLK
jgi:hypothetical protein